MGGDREAGLLGALERVQTLAKTKGSKRITMEIRIERGDTTVKEHEADFSPTDSATALGDRILQILRDSPGMTYKGEVRFNFYELGSTSTRYGSFTRTVTHVVAGGGAALDGTMSSEAGMWKGIAMFLWGILKETLGSQAAMTKAFGDSATAGSVVMLNFARATGRAIDPPSPSSAGRTDLLSGLMKVAEAAAGTDGRAGRALSAAKDVFAPAPPPPSSGGAVPSFGDVATPTAPTAPTGSTETPAPDPVNEPAIPDDDAIKRWAEAHPDRAKAMVRQAILDSGKPGASMVASMIE